MNIGLEPPRGYLKLTLRLYLLLVLKILPYETDKKNVCGMLCEIHVSKTIGLIPQIVRPRLDHEKSLRSSCQSQVVCVGQVSWDMW